MRLTAALLIGVLLAGGCATTPTASYCAAPLNPGLSHAMETARERLAAGCEFHFDSYFEQLLEIARANPDPGTKQQFSNFLLTTRDMGVISTRQAKSLYNRYFNVKFVSLSGDYNTCAQTCPVRAQVLTDMKVELVDKELGLLTASEDRAGYYRANDLLKEAELVLEATCRACEAGTTP